MKTLIDLMKTDEFRITKGQNLIISDPIYSLNKDINEKQLITIEVIPGIWCYEYDGYTRTLDVFQEDCFYTVKRDGINSKMFDEILDIKIESGQIGVFLENSFGNNDTLAEIDLGDKFTDLPLWYRACCIATKLRRRVGFVPSGFVSRTMHENGRCSIGLKYGKGNKKIIYIRVITDIPQKDYNKEEYSHESPECLYCGNDEDDCSCDICIYCTNKEDECTCFYCYYCGNKEDECICSTCCHCGNKDDECSCFYCYYCGNKEYECSCSECPNCYNKERECTCTYCSDCGEVEQNCTCEYCSGCGELEHNCSCSNDEYDY